MTDICGVPVTPAQYNALGRVCIGEGVGISPRTAKALVDKGLIIRLERREPSGLPGVPLIIADYDVASIAVHMAWCMSCGGRGAGA